METKIERDKGSEKEREATREREAESVGVKVRWCSRGVLALMKDCAPAEECKSVRVPTFNIPLCDTSLSERTD